MALKLYVGANDNILTLTGLMNESTQTYINDAAVTVTLVDKNDVQVSGETWPLTMGYIAASNGNYRSILTDTLSATLSNGVELIAQITANAGAGLNGFWEIKINTAKRLT